MSSLCLLALGCGSDKSSSPRPGLSLDRAECRPKDAALYRPRQVPIVHSGSRVLAYVVRASGAGQLSTWATARAALSFI